MAVSALHQFAKACTMELMSTRQCAPTAILRAMLIVANCTFNTCDFSHFKSSDQFHCFCPIKFGFLNVFILIIQQQNCRPVMSWSFRLVIMVNNVGGGARSTWQSWQARSAVKAAGAHWQ